MAVSRQTYIISTDTGEFRTDTGPSFNGAILQMRWEPGGADTGGDLEVLLVNTDTGEAIVVMRDNDCLGSQFTRAPRQSTHDTGGAPSSEALIYSAGERLRVKITPAGVAQSSGKLTVYIDDH